MKLLSIISIVAIVTMVFSSCEKKNKSNYRVEKINEIDFRTSTSNIKHEILGLISICDPNRDFFQISKPNDSIINFNYYDKSNALLLSLNYSEKGDKLKEDTLLDISTFLRNKNNNLYDVIFIGDSALLVSNIGYHLIDTKKNVLLSESTFKNTFYPYTSYRHVPFDKEKNSSVILKNDSLLISFSGASKKENKSSKWDFEAYAWLDLKSLEASIISFKFPYSSLYTGSPWYTGVSAIDNNLFFRYQEDSTLYNMLDSNQKHILKAVNKNTMNSVELLLDRINMPEILRKEYRISWSQFFHLKEQDDIIFIIGLIPDKIQKENRINRKGFIDFYDKNNFSFIKRLWLPDNGLEFPVFYSNNTLFFNNNKTEKHTKENIFKNEFITSFNLYRLNYNY